MTSDRSDPPRRAPTPVRESLGRRPERSEGEGVPARAIQIGEEEWIIRVVGSTEAGHPSDRGAPLIEVEISRANRPEEAVAGALLVGRTLEGVPEEALARGIEQALDLRCEEG